MPSEEPGSLFDSLRGHWDPLNEQIDKTGNVLTLRYPGLNLPEPQEMQVIRTLARRCDRNPLVPNPYQVVTRAVRDPHYLGSVRYRDDPAQFPFKEGWGEVKQYAV